jgi:hypothetical protein
MTDLIGIFQAIGATISPIVAFLLLYKQRKFDQADLQERAKNDLRLRLTAAVWQGVELIVITNNIEEKIRGKSVEPFTSYLILKNRLDIALTELMQIPNWQTDRIDGLARVQDLRSSARLLIEIVDQIILHPIDLVTVHRNDSGLGLKSINIDPISRIDVLLFQIGRFHDNCVSAVDQLKGQLKLV